MTLWQGRMSAEPADALLAFTESLSFDKRLAPVDVAASRAHVRGLERAGLLTAEETASLEAALDLVAGELSESRFGFAAHDEDVHTAVERRVTELAGPVGAKLHTGRSRNDQVATDLRLWAKGALYDIVRAILELQDVLGEKAITAHQSGAYLPGYTHLQRAQAVPLAHHLLAHGWALARDVDRLLETIRRLDVSPLGAGALAGSSLPLDPEATALDLGFASVFDNSLDAVSDRDFVAESLFDLSLLAVHLSRLGEEIVLWTTAEFAFMHLHDAYSTGSSMLPQKKNADIAELTRAKSGRLIGHLSGFLATLKGLPLAYNRDLQEDKEPLFDAVDQVSRALAALAGLLATANFDTHRMAAAADAPELAAVDLADWLATRGTPFREAHALVAGLVQESVSSGTPLPVLAGDRLGPDAAALFEPGSGVGRRTTRGGAGTGPLADQLVRFADRLSADRSRLP